MWNLSNATAPTTRKKWIENKSLQEIYPAIRFKGFQHQGSGDMSPASNICKSLVPDLLTITG